MKRSLFALVILFLLHIVVATETSPDAAREKQYKLVSHLAFRKGEILQYRLHYGLINAGEAELSLNKEVKKFNGKAVYHAVGTGRSLGAFDWFFKVRDRYETYIDTEHLHPLGFIRRVDEGGFKINQDQIFYHDKGKVLSNGKVFSIPGGVQDMLSAFYYARNIDFKDARAGDIYTVKSFVDDELYPMKIKFLGREVLSSDVGKVKCLRFCPVIQTGRIFKKEEDLNVWISDDLNHVPILAAADLMVGSIKMELKGYSGLRGKLALVN